MKPLTARPFPPRSQRGTVVRGLVVLALLAGALALQFASPAWQSRLDALGARIGLATEACPAPAPTAAAQAAPSAGMAAHAPDGHEGRSALMAGDAANAGGAGGGTAAGAGAGLSALAL